MQDLVLTSVPLATIEERFASVVDQKFQSLLTQLKQQQQQNEASEYLSRKETAKLLGISLVTLNEWTKAGTVQGYRIASRVRYKRVELEKALLKIRTSAK